MEDTNLIPALSVGPFRATMTGLLVTGDVTYETWAAYGQGLQTVHQSIHWLIGDWLLLGERLFPDRYTQAVELTHLDYGTLRNDRSVAAHVLPEVRRLDLPHSYHSDIAPLPPLEQARWLEQAVANGWTRDEFRQQVRNAQCTDDTDGRDLALNVIRTVSWELMRTQSLKAVARIVLADQRQGIAS